MKRILIFILLAAVLDTTIGYTMGRLYRSTYTGGRGGLLNYALTKPADVLILGSSRAQYQVMPAVLQQKLSLTAFNAGLQGHDFLYSVMLYDLWKRQHPTPRAVLIQVDIESFLKRDGEMEAAQIFAPYLDDSALVREVLYSADRYKRVEYWSRSYRYNGKLFSIVRNLFVRPDFASDGYLPADGTLNPATDRLFRNALDQDETPMEQARRPYWDVKVGYLKQMASSTSRNGTRLILFHTPLYNQEREAHRQWTERLREMIDSMPGVGFIDICEATRPETFAGRPALYYNANHLNVEGATLYSNMLADALREHLRDDRRLAEDAGASVRSVVTSNVLQSGAPAAGRP